MASGTQPNPSDPQLGQFPGRPSPDGLGRPGQMPVLTDEEKQMMKECERDSFYMRALPISIGCMAAAQAMIKTGRWNPHPRFGPWPKMLITGGIGYFIGKVSYLPVCQSKILEKLPNSNLAHAIRKSRGIPQPESGFGSGDHESEGDFRSKGKLTEEYSASSLEGLDDRNRPSLDRETKPQQPEGEDSKSITYEELRRRNRQEYEDNLAKRPPRSPGSPSYKDSPFMPQPPWPDKPRSRADPMPDDSEISTEPPPSAEPPRRKRTNIWGDPIDD